MGGGKCGGERKRREAYSWPLNNTGFNCADPLKHGFFFFLINTYTVFDHWLGISSQREPTGCIDAVLYRGIERPRIWVSAGSPGTKTPWTLSDS